ncbi:MAG: hypothetical protein ACSHYF_13605 [Verrucomicrobiaceae bacterium]
MKVWTILAICAAAVLFQSGVNGEEMAPTRDLGEWSVGKTIFGTEVNLETLEGQVVMITYWSARDGGETLSQLAGWHGKHKREGFMMIGAEMFESGADEVESVAKRNRVDFTLTKGARGPVSISGFPHTFIFGRRGQMAFSGPTDDPSLENVLKSELAKLTLRRKLVTEEDKAEAGRVIIPLRTWTNREGKDVVAEVIDVKKGYVLFRLESGKELSYEIEKLSPDDQKLIRDTLLEQSGN